MSIFLSSLLCLTAKQAFENQTKRILFYPTDLPKIFQNDSSTGYLMGFLKNLYMYNFIYDDNASRQWKSINTKDNIL